MNVVLAAVLIAVSLTMLTFAKRGGYVPVSSPTHRVYRAIQHRYFWTLIAGYALVGAIGIGALLR